MTDGDDPSIGSHFARDLEKFHNSDIRESRNVGGSPGSSRFVTDRDDPSTRSHFARDLEKNHYHVMMESRLFVWCLVVAQLRFIVHQSGCLGLLSFRTRYIQ